LVVKSLLIAVAGTAALLALSTAASAAKYSVTPVGPVHGGAYDINGAGDVVGAGGHDPSGQFASGWIVNGDGISFSAGCGLSQSGINSSGVAAGAERNESAVGSHPCIFDSRTDSTLSIPPGPLCPLGSDGAGIGINDAGDVAGSCGERAILWTKTETGYSATKLSNAPSAANDTAARGQAVGQRLNSAGLWRAFLYSGGQMHGLGTLGGSSVAVNISGTGYIVGTSDTATPDTLTGPEHAFRYFDGTMRDLHTLGGRESGAESVDRYGRVVGWSKTSSGNEHAFIWKRGTMYDLNKLIPGGSGWVLIVATGNNGKGQIVGNGIHNGVEQGFLLTPLG
jgi:probable HAF family extracellular repeat protein